MTCALLVMDMQKAIFALKKPVFAADGLIQSVNAAICAARAGGIQIVFTRHENKSFLIKGTPGWQIADGIDVRESDAVIEKKHPDVFADTGLDGLLQEEGVDTLIIAGLVSNGCVKAACLSAIKRGYGVYLLSDAHSTFYKNAEKIIADTNREMEAAGVRLITVGEMAAIVG